MWQQHVEAACLLVRVGPWELLALDCRPDRLGRKDNPAGKDAGANAGPLLGPQAGGEDPRAVRDQG